MNEFVEHTLEPIYNADSKILILGTMPSPKSRLNNFYYANPQNRFWRIMADIFGTDLPSSNDERRELILKHNIALWDVLKSCTINGASDPSIKDPVPNDIKSITDKTKITEIFTTGSKAYRLYGKLCMESTGIQAHLLPSTSPANCRNITYDDILREYSVLLAYI